MIHAKIAYTFCMHWILHKCVFNVNIANVACVQTVNNSKRDQHIPVVNSFPFSLCDSVGAEKESTHVCYYR